MAASTVDKKAATPQKSLAATLKSGSFLFKLIFIAVLLIWPLILNNTYDMSVMTTAGYYAMIVVAVSLILGQAGQLSLAHNAFYGIGAYVAAILATTYHWNTLLSLFVGALAAGGVAILIGKPVLKLKYFYLALATLGLGQIFGIVVTQLTITGGANGFGPIPTLSIFGFDVGTYMRQYYVIWIVVILTLLFTDRALKYRFGRSLRSLATSEIAASTLGVRTANWKLVAFVVGALYCGFAGGLFAFFSVAIMPGSFGFAAAVLPVVMMLVGGDQNIWGGAIGAIVLTWVVNGFPQLQEYSGVTYSVVMILLLMFLPMGIVGLFSPTARARFRKRFGMKDKGDFGEVEALPTAEGTADFEASMAEARAEMDGDLEAAREAGAAPPVLLRVEGVTVQFGGLKAVNDVSMEVREGEITALIGPNGAGKTTLFNAVSRLQTITTGAITFQGHDVTKLSPPEVARLGMARTFQNLRIFANMDVLENVLVGCHRHERSGMFSEGVGLPGQRAEERASRDRAFKTLELLGLEQYAMRPAASLPYGIQRLVEIARAVASEPKLLMLDEPAAGMNAHERAYLVDRIGRIRDAGISVLLVEHDIGLVMGISDAVNCLDYGKLIACGTPTAVQQDEAVIAAYLGDGKARVASHREAEHATACEDCMLVVDDLVTSYGTIEALHGVSFEVPKGQIVAVLGANGAGKTTLLETISGLLKPGRGRITYAGKDITRVAPHKIARAGLGHVPEGRQLFPTLTVEDNLVLGATSRADKAGLQDDIAFVYEVFPVLGERRKQKAGTLSGGEQQMLAIGRAITGRPDLLLLDEPSMGLAPLTVDRIFEGLQKLNEQGLTMLMVEQNAEMALSIADYAVVLQTGNVVIAESATALRQDDRVRASYLGQSQSGARAG